MSSSKTIKRPSLFVRILLCVLLILFLVSSAGTFMREAHSSEREKALIRAGLDLFSSLLAADIDIDRKKGTDGSLLLTLVYVNDKEAAANMALHLKKIKQIKQIPIRIELQKVDSLLADREILPAGIFITERIDKRIQDIVGFGIKHHIVVFSPFEADVSRGVLGGIVVRERILPYINMETMRFSGIEIKPFFLRVAKQYE